MNLVCGYIQNSQQNNQDDRPTLAQLSDQAGASPGYVHRVFKRLMGIMPRQYADACRRDRFKARLREGWDVLPKRCMTPGTAPPAVFTRGQRGIWA